ncbi:MAG: cytochrome c oxidase subunit II [Actinobacteria bacterium]|nr:cytochrome c oxidase subunit II [Actinomycetota bacterium]
MWVGLVAAVVVVAVVLIALLGVVRRFRAARGSEPRQLTGPRRVQLPVAAVLTAFALALFVISVVLTDEASNAPSTGANGLVSAKGKPLTKPLEIETTGQQWIWRYDYPNGAFSYYKLVVPVDTAVKLNLVSTDIVHTWDVGDLTGKADAVPGKTHSIVFRAEEEGNFYGQSATFSGQAYAQMRSEIEVVSADEYKAFIKKQKEDIESAQKRVEELLTNGEVP